MGRVGHHALQLRIDDEIHGLERKDPHQAFVSEYSSLGQKRTVLELDFDGLDAWNAHPSGISDGEAVSRGLFEIKAQLSGYVSRNDHVRSTCIHHCAHDDTLFEIRIG